MSTTRAVRGWLASFISGEWLIDRLIVEQLLSDTTTHKMNFSDGLIRTECSSEITQQVRRKKQSTTVYKQGNKSVNNRLLSAQCASSIGQIIKSVCVSVSECVSVCVSEWVSEFWDPLRIWCWRRLVAYHITSVLAGFSWFELVHLETSLTHSEIVVDSELTAVTEVAFSLVFPFYEVMCAHICGYVAVFTTVACSIYSQLKWYKNYSSRSTFAGVTVSSSRPRFVDDAVTAAA